jgi:broad specificity phosphatase PhoE
MHTTLYLIRHGVTDWNKQKRYCGYIDVPLSQEGSNQAARLAKRIKSIPIDVVYSSDLKRAVKTARIVFGKIKIKKIPELQEMNFGVFEGLHQEDILKNHGPAYKKWLINPYKNHIPEGESINSFQKRVTAAIKKIVAANRGKNIAVVCHGGTISVLLTSILKKEIFWKYVPGSTSVSIIEYKNNKPRIKLFNCTRHLK